VGYLENLWNALDFGSLRDMVLRLVSVFLCLTVHETCHGLAALALGDPTAKRARRLSLNPLRHIDWFGLLMMITVGFGWAKPVPVDPRYFRRPKQGMALTALAGPVSNFLLALVLLFAGRLAGAFERAMPHGIAEMMAMTVAAQLFTLPIQVLMEPELPLLSVPANLLVSPFVGLATMAGLMALACAWCEPWLAGVFAWISSWGTLVMERVALWLGGSTMAVIPWKDGVTGAVLIVAVEIGIGMLLVFVSRCLQHVRRYEAGMPGVRFGSAWRVRLSLWCEETRRLFTRRQAE
jgi:Zn-dependent protease